VGLKFHRAYEGPDPAALLAVLAALLLDLGCFIAGPWLFRFFLVSVVDLLKNIYTFLKGDVQNTQF